MEELELEDNEEFLGEYGSFYLVKVKCPENKFYRTTISKWKATSREKNIKYEMEKRLDNKKYNIE